MIRDRKQGHLGMASTDINATVKWYIEVLGYEKIGDFKAPNGDNIQFIRNAQGNVYEIFPASENASKDSAGKIDHYCFESQDIEKDYKYCVNQGYKITTKGIESIPTLWEKGVRYFKIGSPTGEDVEFCQIL